MNIGEIRKRIQESSVWKNNEMIHISGKSLDKILDDANADFPDPSDFEDCVGEDDDQVFDGWKYKEAVEAWGKKWVAKENSIPEPWINPDTFAHEYEREASKGADRY